MLNGIAIFDKNCTWNVEGNISGTIKFHQCSPQHPTKVCIDLDMNRINSTHALHIHEYANLLEGCMGAGGHYNPYNETHGSVEVPEYGRHAGDLRNNVTSDLEGKVVEEFYDELVTLYGPNSVFGRTLVIHDGIDDLGLGGNKESLITGNAGGRLACAVIGRAR